MPDLKRERVHRFRDHVVAGVNWRPTRFVDEVPNSCVCGLCRMIPKRTVLLPCSHVLCQSCHAGSSVAGAGLCPLDREPFEESECHGADLPARNANALQVCCWNEAHGCEFVGTVEGVLRHYENECTFHVVECLRCGKGVAHRNLPSHYVTGCSAGDPAALTLQDATSALEYLQTALRDQGQLLAAVQSQANEVAEQVRSQEAGFAELARKLRASEHNLKEEVAQISAAISLAVSHQPPSRQNPVRETSPSSQEPLCLENTLMLRKLERLASFAVSDLERLRQDAPPNSRQPAVAAHCVPFFGREESLRHLNNALRTACMLGGEHPEDRYLLTVENADEIFQCQEQERQFARVTVPHTGDAYFNLAVGTAVVEASTCLAVAIQFNGMPEGSLSSLPRWYVSALHPENVQALYMHASDKHCTCVRDRDTTNHFHRLFWASLSSLKCRGYLRDGMMTFEVHLSGSTDSGGTRASNADEN
ncbi:uncharacterized protein [Dermacentor andersoni]|uniref:uncharacterized protein isoform X2 n=1 Tax=Dermacentor andersoni TaxID=34620 RepID=UPI003B3B971B